MFFSAPRAVGIAKALRLCRRRWSLFRPITLTGLIRWLSRSEFTHVAVGCESTGAVVSPVLTGNQFWPLIPFIQGYPDIVEMVRVPIARPLNLDRIGPGGPKPALPTVLRWVTRGRVRTTDCCCIVVELLRDSGVNVPRHIVTPGQLRHWLVHVQSCQTTPLG